VRDAHIREVANRIFDRGRTTSEQVRAGNYIAENMVGF
jgi:hypothetical protein